MRLRLQRSLLAPVLLLALPFTLVSCATIATGSKDNVSFVSNPEGATVTVGGRVIGKTPVTVSLKPKSEAVTFEKEGYKPLSMQLETRMNGWFWGNIVIGGLLGSTTDGASGAAYKYAPSQYMVTLEPTSVTMGIEKGTERANAQKIREFVVMGYPQLVHDVKTGSGEYLASLHTLLRVPEAERPNSVNQLRVILAENSAIPDFADRVAALERPE
jgi:hypothetical protein